MTTCNHCRKPIEGEWTRRDAGITTDGKRSTVDVNLHNDCYGPWMLQHYPWLCRVSVRDRTSLP